MHFKKNYLNSYIQNKENWSLTIWNNKDSAMHSLSLSDCYIFLPINHIIFFFFTFLVIKHKLTTTP